MGGTDKAIDVGHLLGVIGDALGGHTVSHLSLSCRIGGSAIALTVEPVRAQMVAPHQNLAGRDLSSAADLGGFADRLPNRAFSVVNTSDPLAQQAEAPAPAMAPAEPPADTVVDLAVFDRGVVPPLPLPACGAGQTDAPLPASVRTPPAPGAGEPLAPRLDPAPFPGAQETGGASAPADAARPLPIVERIAASWARGHRSVASIATDINEPIQRVKNNMHHAQKRGLLAQAAAPPETTAADSEPPAAPLAPPDVAGDTPAAPGDRADRWAGPLQGIAGAPEITADPAHPYSTPPDSAPPDLRCPKEAAIVVAKHGAAFYAAGPTSRAAVEIGRPAYLALRRMAGGQMFGLGTLATIMGYAADKQDVARGVLRGLKGKLLDHGVVMTESAVGWVLRRA
jgi:hypothetical protein